MELHFLVAVHQEITAAFSFLNYIKFLNIDVTYEIVLFSLEFDKVVNLCQLGTKVLSLNLHMKTRVLSCSE